MQSGGELAFWWCSVSPLVWSTDYIDCIYVKTKIRMAWLWYSRFSGFYSAIQISRSILEYEVGMS